MTRKLTCEAYGRKQRTVMTYGTFDLLHYGHIKLCFVVLARWAIV